MKRSLILLFILTIAIASQGAIRITAKAPSSVAVGEQFRVQYSVNSSDVNGGPRVGSFSGFTVLYGPAVSTSTSVQIINGNFSKNASTTYTYTLEATKEGTFTLPAASVNVDGQTYTSNKVQVTVRKGSAAAPQPQASRHPSATPQPRANANPNSFDPKDLYIEVSANKKEVYEQEPVLLSYNVYTNLMLDQLQGKMPDLKGFVSKEVPLPREKHLGVTQHNGRTCQTVTWSKYVMFPQQSGKLTVPSIPFEGVIMYPNPNVDPVDAFFFGSSAVTRVNRTIKAPGLDIVVKPLPAKPAGFSGAVGKDFSIKSALATKTPRENEMLTLRVTINGVGNIELITPPEVQFPADFETYGSKPTSKTEITTEGMNGSLTIDYMAIPNHQGSFTVPPVKLIYFSPADGTYHTIESSPVSIQVAKGNPNSYAARQRLKDNDIRDIHTDELTGACGDNFWIRPAFWVVNGVVVVLFVIVLVVLVVLERRNNDVRGTTLRKANSKAVARLKNADKFKQEGRGSEFFAETLSALRGIVADKTGVPVAELSTERIVSLFGEYGVDAENTAEYQSLVSECEAHIYGASVADAAGMQTVYERALALILSLNPMLKKKK